MKKVMAFSLAAMTALSMAGCRATTTTKTRVSDSNGVPRTVTRSTTRKIQPKLPDITKTTPDYARATNTPAQGSRLPNVSNGSSTVSPKSSYTPRSAARSGAAKKPSYRMRGKSRKIPTNPNYTTPTATPYTTTPAAGTVTGVPGGIVR